MQPTLRTDSGSLPARTALHALSADLQLHPVVLARALEYALDNLSFFPSAAEAVCFGVVRQGHCIDMQILDVALLRLRRNFGGTLGDAPVVRSALGQWFARPSGQSETIPAGSAMAAPMSQFGSSLNSARSSSLSVAVCDDGAIGRDGLMSFSSPPVGVWPAPQRGHSCRSALPSSSPLDAHLRGPHRAGEGYDEPSQDD